MLNKKRVAAVVLVMAMLPTICAFVCRAQQAEAPEGVTPRRDVAYREGNDAWKLDIALPAEDSDRPRPGIVFVHGGGRRGGDKGRGYFTPGAVEYARRGCVCISVNYRLTDEAPFPACVEDVNCAVRWLRAHAEQYNLDPQRIGAYGNSAGAHLAAMLGLGRECDKNSFKRV